MGYLLTELELKLIRSSKPRIKVINRHGVDIFITKKSETLMKKILLTKESNRLLIEHFRLEQKIKDEC